MVANPIHTVSNIEEAQHSPHFIRKIIPHFLYALCYKLRNTHIFLMDLQPSNGHVKVLVEDWACASTLSTRILSEMFQLSIILDIDAMDATSTGRGRFRIEYISWKMLMTKIPCQSISEYCNQFSRYDGIIGIPFSAINEK
jgi:hypothetical protein